MKGYSSLNKSRRNLQHKFASKCFLPRDGHQQIRNLSRFWTLRCTFGRNPPKDTFQPDVEKNNTDKLKSPSPSARMAPGWSLGTFTRLETLRSEEYWGMETIKRMVTFVNFFGADLGW